MKYDQGVKKDEVITLDVPKAELEKMVEIDYQHRLAYATHDEIILKRTPQEIIEECNRQEYSSWKKHNRYKASLKNEEESAEIDVLDILTDLSQVENYQKQDDYDEICQKIRDLLNSEQADMIIAILIDGMRVKDYAAKIQDNPINVSKRFNRIKIALKELYKNEVS